MYLKYFWAFILDISFSVPDPSFPFIKVLVYYRYNIDYNGELETGNIL